MNNKELIHKLKEISKEKSNSIKREVAKKFFNHLYENVRDYFEDLQNHGCKSGMIGSLISPDDTHKFFNIHYKEIEDLHYEYEKQGIEVKPVGDLMSWYAWFAFEKVAEELAIELGIYDYN